LGFRRNAPFADYLGQIDLITELVSTVACGGNLLLNVGPTFDGLIIPLFRERLLGMGQWLAINGEAIYSTTPWRSQNDTAASVWYTAKGSDVYAMALKWPADGQLKLTQPKPSGNTQVYLLGNPSGAPLNFTSGGTGLVITLPQLDVNTNPSIYAWTFKLLNVS